MNLDASAQLDFIQHSMQARGYEMSRNYTRRVKGMWLKRDDRRDQSDQSYPAIPAILIETDGETVTRSRSQPTAPTDIPPEFNGNQNGDGDTNSELEGMSDLELLHYQFRRKLMTPDVDIRVLDSFRQFLKEMDEFERVKERHDEEIQEELQTKGVDQLVQLALGKRRFKFSQDADLKESSFPSGSSSSSSNSRTIMRDGN